MILFWPSIFVWQLSWLICHGLSNDLYHTLSRVWVTHPEPVDAYFGFSVAYEPANKRLIVSAPQHDDIGEVYSCDLDSRTCSGVKKHQKLTNKNVDRKDSHKSWFGATVKAGPSYFVTCAPRHLEKKSFSVPHKGKTNNDPGTFSLCYKYENKTKEYTPIAIKSFTDKQRNTGSDITLYEHIMDSLGWSIDISGDQTLIGGPAMYTGRVLKPTDDSHDSTLLSGYLPDKVNPRRHIRKIYYNFGYSVLMGHFYETKNKALIYAISSTYGSNGYGMVLFYEMMTSGPSLKRELRDTAAVGAMFGAALCSARLDAASSLDWLIVGAPAYADTKAHHVNQGAVYIYEPKQLKVYKKIVGKDDSFFGSAIANLGDFNGDKMDEIAIAAPYEDSGTGAVYLYSSKDIKNTESLTVAPMQRITPETLDAPIKSFGISLASIQDFDENGCNELAIGAPESNQVMVLRCIALATVQVQDITYFKKSPMNPGDDIKLSFESCLNFQFPEKPENVAGRIKVTIKLTLEDKKLDVTPSEYDITLNKALPKQCKQIHVVGPKTGNYEFPIRYNITAVDVEPARAQREFQATHLAVSDRSKLHCAGALWFSDCADRHNCEPNLAIRYNNTIRTPEYMIGSSSSIPLASAVQNSGEVAYSACVRVWLEGVEVEMVPVGCEQSVMQRGTPPATHRVVLCRPDHSLRSTDTPWILPGLSLDTSKLTSKDKSIEIHMEAYNHCSKLDKSNSIDHTITLKSDDRFHIKGMTDSGVDQVNMTKHDVDGKAFDHNYYITNVGVTNWVDLKAIVLIQNRSFIEYSPIIISNSGHDPCTLEHSEDKEFMKYSCLIEKLFVNQEPVKLTIPMIIQYQGLENIARESQSQLSSVTLFLDGKQNRASVLSQLNYKGKIAIWIIVVAAVIGILIVLLFCFIMSRCGFFKRNQKKKLEQVRQSVRRQTMMHRPQADGMQDCLLTEQRGLVSVPEETAEQAAARDRRVRLDSNAAVLKKPAPRKK